MNDFARASMASALVCVFATLAAYTHLMLNKENSAEVASKIVAPTASHAPLRAEATLPRVLSPQDTATYRHLFAAQEKGDWKAADALIARVENRILLGYAQSQRYLHKNYQSSPRELALWLAKYSDLPQANQVYSLAQRKGVKNAKTPLNKPAQNTAAAVGSSQPFERFGATLVNRYLRYHPLKAQLRNLLVQERRAQALALLGQATQLSPRDYDLLRWYVASSFFNHGEYGQAAILASASANRSGQSLPALHWIAGLANWHKGDITAAYQHFSTMAKMADKLNRADAAAAIFWAHRAADQLGESDEAEHYLQQASLYPDTFYGIQASKALERDLALNLSAEPLTQSEMRHLLHYNPIRRVLALGEIGKRHEAEQELRMHYASARTQHHEQLLSLAVMLDFPAAQMRMASDLKKQGVPALDYALYPTPNWQSSRNTAVEPALVFAIARQESGFNPAARSHAGASGVMQLMPETARYLLSRAKFKGDMQDPATNIALGQQYIHHLQQQPAIRDNLVYTIAAYNAGPAPLIGWKQQLDYKNDPLLFVESIPFAETRSYVLHVLTNYWIYNEIIGNTNASVHAMLDGKWPLSLTGRQQVASTAANQPHDL